MSHAVGVLVDCPVMSVLHNSRESRVCMVHANQFLMAILSCWAPRFLFIANVSFHSLLLRVCMSHALGLLLLSVASSLHAAGARIIKPRSSLCLLIRECMAHAYGLL